MAQPVPHQTANKKRVKVYELRNNDWFDRGTGFCSAAFVSVEEGQPKEAHVTVASEDTPERLLLETKICKGDGFQKQQDTLIVWTEASNGVDMALSFQEAEGCALIWKFIDGVQQTFQTVMGPPDDTIADDITMELPAAIHLPAPDLGNLIELEASMRIMSSSANGRDALAKSIVKDDYISKLIPLVEEAEDLEDLTDLHRMCNIMKMILLLNDTSIIEHAVSDECVLGVVGALEYDPDFPNHKANHRQWLRNQGRYKEVVRIEDDQIRRKIHQTYRLQYLKDVVLARILDDPTFSVLNSLIFFNQVDIVQHLQSNGGFLADLFGVFADPSQEQLRKKEAVLFIQQCCAIAKNLQPPARQTLYSNFLSHGLFQVINYGLRNLDVTVRVGATDILVSMIDHDPQMIRHTIYRQVHEKQPALTDTLIDLLLVEVDLGIKSQVSETLKVLLDPSPLVAPPEARAEFMQHRVRLTMGDPQQEHFLGEFYKENKSAQRLFRPLLDLENRTDMQFDVNNDGIFGYLNDILCFYVRQHHNYTKYFIITHNIAQRFLQLLACKEKHLQLVAIRFFRQLITLQDDFYIRLIADKQILGPVLDVLIQTMGRDNLLGSACLDLFGHINKESVKDLMKHLVENYREKLQQLSTYDIFREILVRYDNTQGFCAANPENYFIESEDEMGRRPAHPGSRIMMEHLAVDPAQEEYWNTSDDEEDTVTRGPEQSPATNGSTPKPLVEYSSDEEGEAGGDVDKDQSDHTVMAESKANGIESKGGIQGIGAGTPDDTRASESPSLPETPPPERLSEKRRREEDEEDQLGKMMLHKRRNSSSTSLNSVGSAAALRNKKKTPGGRDSSPMGPAKKIAISISPVKTTQPEHDD